MRKTVGATLVAAGLLSGLQVAEAAPDADIVACSVSVSGPEKVGDIISATAKTWGCPATYRFRLALQRQVIVGWLDLASVTWTGNQTRTVSSDCTGTHTYRVVFDNLTTGETKPSSGVRITC